MAQWIEDPQGRLEVEKVTKEMKLPVWKANHKGKFRDFWNELWDKIEDYVVKLKGDTEKKSKGLNDRLVSAVGKHDGDFPISNAVVGNVYYSELTKKYYKCKIGGPAPMPNGNFIDMSILENLNRLENLIKVIEVDTSNFTIVINYLTDTNLIVGGYLLVKSNFRVGASGFIHNLGNNLTLNGSFLTYTIGNERGKYFYQPHKISIKNGNIVSNVADFNIFTTKVFYN